MNEYILRCTYPCFTTEHKILHLDGNLYLVQSTGNLVCRDGEMITVCTDSITVSLNKTPSKKLILSKCGSYIKGVFYTTRYNCGRLYEETEALERAYNIIRCCTPEISFCEISAK